MRFLIIFSTKHILLQSYFYIMLGFGKNINHNFNLLNNLSLLNSLKCPIVVGVSRKSMIYKTLGCNPKQALNGTSVLNTLCLDRGAKILRVHDVNEINQSIKVFNSLLVRIVSPEICFKNTEISNPNNPWELVTDNIPQNVAVSSIAYDPNNTKKFYVGTGESYTAGDALGNGLWRSVDGGDTWEKVFGGDTDNPTTYISEGNKIKVIKPEGQNDIQFLVSSFEVWLNFS